MAARHSEVSMVDFERCSFLPANSAPAQWFASGGRIGTLTEVA